MRGDVHAEPLSKREEFHHRRVIVAHVRLDVHHARLAQEHSRVHAPLQRGEGAHVLLGGLGGCGAAAERYGCAQFTDT